MADETRTMRAARLYGPSDLRVEDVPHPGAPGAGEVLLRVLATGVCGSDLHPYESGSIGDTVLNGPLILGHEFSGVIEEVGEGVEGLAVGTRVAVDPSQPCLECRECRDGNPNLCRRQKFCGLAPYDGSLCQWMRVPARTCHVLPEQLSDEEGALLEPLGIAMHATDLARIRVGNSVAVFGAGPIGLLLIQMAIQAGASPVYYVEKLDWRCKLAEKFGAIPLPQGVEVDTAIEAAWVEGTAQLAMETARPGGTVVLVGIPLEDKLEIKHSTARRKGLTILMCRRMKNVYRRGIALVESGKIDLKSLVTHRRTLEETPAAFALNAHYEDGVVKIIIRS